MKYFLVSSLLLAVALAGDSRWEHYQQNYLQASRDPAKAAEQKQVFQDNLELLDQHNKDYAENKVTFEVGVNELTGLPEKKAKRLRGRRVRLLMKGEADPIPANILAATAPASLDYRKLPGYLNRVRQQGGCGSCYTFGSTGALEAQVFKKTGKTFELSKQQIVDCDTNNGGCEGGLEMGVYRYIMSAGIAKETTYPYKGYKGPCTYNKGMAAVQVKDYKNFYHVTDDELMKILHVVGPVSIGIDSSDYYFTNYKRGVYSNRQCNPANLDHAVVLIGYGTDPKEGPFWIIKNSWGDTWGQGGYGYVKRGGFKVDCGISMDINYPVL